MAITALGHRRLELDGRRHSVPISQAWNRQQSQFSGSDPEELSPVTRFFYWVQAELVAMATDLAEFVGAALGFHLLFAIDLRMAALLRLYCHSSSSASSKKDSGILKPSSPFLS